MHFEVTRMINARPDRIWAVLTNKQQLISGNFGVLKIEGDIVFGGKIKLWSEANPGRAFPLRVSTFVPATSMVWEGGMPFGLFKGIRKFVIEPVGAGSRFQMREDYSGLLSGLIGKSIPDLNPSFEKFADALKFYSEGDK